MTSHAMPPTAVVTPRGSDRLRAGHPWIYRSDVVRSDAAPGDLVRVETERARPIGWAFWSSASQIALRVISTDTRRQAPDERTLIADRVKAAAAYRATLGIDASAWRVVHGEADRLPATVVDRYEDPSGTYFVVQTLSEASDRRRDLLRDVLIEQFAPRGILARNDPKVRRLEGLDERVDVLYGEIPDAVLMREGGAVLRVDLRHGQKTGGFLDQRENHRAAAGYTRGRALDAFTYNGGFALAMAPHAESVLALDSSAPAVAAAADNARRNGWAHVEVREANVCDELRELQVAGRTFETIVLDPPAFAKNRASVPRALAGYKEINLRALRLLAPGGHLITCSCSYNVDETLFADVIAAAAVDARSQVVLVEQRMQARDHPVLVGVPETHYLKCAVLRKL
jgi:23S rRNA (cytosine1962-C5)-methyltransferase